MLDKRFLLKIISLMIFLNFTSEIISQTCIAIPICTHYTDQSYPVVSNRMIVWRDCRNGTWDIYGYDLSIDTDNDGVPNWLDPDRPDPDPAEFLVCELPYAEPWKTDISGNFIVFSYIFQGMMGIGGYDLVNNKEFLISPGKNGRKASAIGNSIVAWMDYRNGRWCIYAYSLHHDSDEDGIPDIYDPDRHDPTWAGNMIGGPNPWWSNHFPDVSEKVAVWEVHGGGTPLVIWGYDLQVDSDNDGIPNWLDYDRPWPDTIASFNLIPDRGGKRGAVAADGNFVIWEEGLDDSSDVHGYDLSVDTDADGIPNYLDSDRPDPDPAEFVITSAPGKQGGTASNFGPAISGNWVVWIDFRNGNADIYGYDLSEDTDGDGTPNYCDPDRPNPDPAEKPIVTDPSNQWLVRGSAFSGSVLTWLDDRNGNNDVYAGIIDPDANLINPIACLEDKLTTTDLNMPQKFEISQNYPNPFNSETMIEYNILEATDISIKIFDLLGREIATLVDENKMPGVYAVRWNGKDKNGDDLASGVYYYQIGAGDFIQTKKLALIK